VIDDRFDPPEKFADASDQLRELVAKEVEECLWMLRQSFVSNIWTCAWSAASFNAWWQTQSELPVYQHLRRALQLIGNYEPQKRCLLKSPGHIANLDLLFAVFPDACVIQTHRDPAKSIPSVCEILIQGHDVMEVGRKQQRAHIMGNRETGKWSKAVRDAEPVRASLRDQIVDIIHGEFHREPMKIMKRIDTRFSDWSPCRKWPPPWRSG